MQSEITISGFFFYGDGFYKIVFSNVCIGIVKTYCTAVDQVLININSPVLASFHSIMFTTKNLDTIPLKVTSNMQIFIGNVFSSLASLLPSTIRLNGLLLMSLSKSFLISYPRQFLIAAAFFFDKRTF